MTPFQAQALADKRNLHKSKHLTHMRWVAKHDSVKGWHAALTENHAIVVQQAMMVSARASLGETE